jgi:hypothetical protein
MYFADLTPYQYGRAEPQPDVLNVGWLGANQPFSCRPPSENFVTALKELIASPVNLFRGSHLCEFCPRPPTVLSKGGIPMLNPSPGTLGNGEIHVEGASGITYIAPVLILHYVVEHQYFPPQEFIDAVLQSRRKPGSN